MKKRLYLGLILLFILSCSRSNTINLEDTPFSIETLNEFDGYIEVDVLSKHKKLAHLKLENSDELEIIWSRIEDDQIILRHFSLDYTKSEVELLDNKVSYYDDLKGIEYRTLFYHKSVEDSTKYELKAEFERKVLYLEDY